MSTLPKEKRNQLLLVVMVTGIVLCGLWFGLISFQQQKLRNLAQNNQNAGRKLKQMELSIKNAGQIEADLVESSRKLAELENGMVSGDPYSWAINTIRQFKQPYKLDIPQFSAIDGPKDVSLLASFPYKQVAMSIGGTAFFHDFGRFVADFENQYPYVRVLNVNLEPVPQGLGTEREKLSFKMDILFLVKPSAG